MKIRRNALHRVYPALKDRIEEAGFKLDPDKRIIFTENVSYTIRSYASSAECKKFILGIIRPMEVSKKISKEVLHEVIKKRIQPPIL